MKKTLSNLKKKINPKLKSNPKKSNKFKKNNHPIMINPIMMIITKTKKIIKITNKRNNLKSK